MNNQFVIEMYNIPMVQYQSALHFFVYLFTWISAFSLVDGLILRYNIKNNTRLVLSGIGLAIGSYTYLYIMKEK
uniref:Uncharacterized protein n=1 Tax=viral metagenome TaxID=1070528 RepID=A0A6C0F7R2_9ZZZZ